MGNRFGNCDSNTRTNSFAYFSIFLPRNISQSRAFNVFRKRLVMRSSGSRLAVRLITFSASKPETRKHKITRDVQSIVFGFSKNFNRLCRGGRRSHGNCGPISDAGFGSVIQFRVTISKGNSDSRTTRIALRP